MMAYNQRLGKIGEQAAVKYLKGKGYHILEQNYRCPYGEVDIIAKDKGVLVFVEVKSRTSDKYGTPLESVDIYKQKKLRQLAAYYLHGQEQFFGQCRFDVVGVVLSKKGEVREIKLIKNAF
ncbi:MAG: YraN family protein [Thermoanaerobacteraceae bacterium]|nr:YraN family protein [Thermoanaerobacteraceae bacterium]